MKAPARYTDGELVDVRGRTGWERGIYVRRSGKRHHRVYVARAAVTLLFADDHVRIAQHRVEIETMQKTGRRKDAPRSRWSCSCGAGDRKLTTPVLAHAAADAHYLQAMAAS